MKKTFKVILILISLVFLIVGSLLLTKYKEQAQDEKQVKEEVKQNSLIVDEIEQEIKELDKEIKANNKKVNYKQKANELLDKLNEENGTDNIIAFLDTGEGGIREVIGYRSDSDYFDRKNIRGEYDYYGTAFLYRENKSPLDDYTNYFAHNVYTGERFHKLARYDKYKDNLQTATLYTREGILTYELVQVAVVDSELYDDFVTWEKEGLRSYFEESSWIGEVLLQREKFEDGQSYMLLHTCYDDIGVEKAIGVYKLVETFV